MKGGKKYVIDRYIRQNVRESFFGKYHRGHPFATCILFISHNEGDRQIQLKANDVEGTLYHLSFYH